jgi:cytoplasmic iron level regulating protein YaaA (DUF328/UPF0246 family)
MKIILSPTKSLNEAVKFDSVACTSIGFPEETSYLIKKLSKLSKGKIGKLMDISPDLASLNYDRFQNFQATFTPENSFPAGYVFSGAAYQGLDFTNLSSTDQEEGQKRLRILSGLYGLLKPFDLIQPYRLEMGTSLAITPKMTNLYKFWQDKIHQRLMDELKEEDTKLLVNVASSEYFKAARLEKMKGIEVITPVFKDRNKNGDYKVNMTFAKLARGRMARFIIEEKIDRSEDLKSFNATGYSFVVKDSTPTEFVFHRD